MVEIPGKKLMLCKKWMKNKIFCNCSSILNTTHLDASGTWARYFSLPIPPKAFKHFKLIGVKTRTYVLAIWTVTHTLSTWILAHLIKMQNELVIFLMRIIYSQADEILVYLLHFIPGFIIVRLLQFQFSSYSMYPMLKISLLFSMIDFHRPLNSLVEWNWMLKFFFSMIDVHRSLNFKFLCGKNIGNYCHHK